ncbi:hypothetical protein DFJ73DRAFT_885788 [Zopfochytrium polystomum]|nr:hypothetical protein DFJ73DRAFT_885788 [Zopfochytrium polystomum]
MDANASFDAMISYCWANHEVARQVSDHLKSLGFKIWIDTSNMKGNIYSAMTAAVLSSTVVVPFISDDYVNSGNCFSEIQFARDKRKKLLPVRLSHSPRVADSPIAFITAGLLYHDLSPPIWEDEKKKDAALADLVAALKSALQEHPSALSLNTLGTRRSVPALASPNALVASPTTLVASPTASVLSFLRNGTCFPYMPVRHDPPQWIDRTDLWTMIDEHLQAFGIAILEGIGGSGKTFTALKYAHRALRDGLNVSWVGAKTEEELRQNLIRFAAHVFSLRVVEKDLDILLDKLIPALCDDHIPRLFVLDNVDNVLDVEKLLAAVKDIPTVRVLITTRIPLVLPGHVQPMKSIPVSFPSIDSCRSYFLDIPGRTLTEPEADRIFHLCNGLPLRLSVAAAYLARRPDLSVDAFVRLVEKEKTRKLNPSAAPAADIYPEVSVSLDTLQKKSPEAFELVHWLALLDPDRTVLEYVVQALKKTQQNLWFLFGRKRPDGANLHDVLGPLVDLKLVSYKKSFLSMHRCVQSVVLEKTPVPRNQGEYFANVYRQLFRENYTVQRKLAVRDVAGLAEMLSLMTEVILYDAQLEAKDVKLLCNVLRTNTTIQKLSLQANHSVGPEGARAVSELLKSNGTLQSVDLEWNGIGDGGVKAIADALKVNSTLLSLSLKTNYFGLEGAKAVADSLIYNSTLESIDLCNNYCRDEGTKVIADALKRNNTLQFIDLESNRIGYEGASAVADALKSNSALQSVSLARNNIGDKGAAAIADALKSNSSLQSIVLWGANIGNDGADAIADALKINSTLQSVKLSGNNFDTEGENALAQCRLVNKTVKVVV